MMFRCLGFCETDYNDAPYRVSSFLKIRQQNYMLHRIFAWTKQEVVNWRLDAWSVGGSWYQMSIFFSVSCYVKLNSLRTLSKFNICIFWIWYLLYQKIYLLITVIESLFKHTFFQHWWLKIHACKQGVAYFRI